MCNIGTHVVVQDNNTHALVQFDDNSTSVVPVSRVISGDGNVAGLVVGGDCSVLWTNKKRYNGSLILTGNSTGYN